MIDELRIDMRALAIGLTYFHLRMGAKAVWNPVKFDSY
jgi:hypothetical protein